MGERIGHLCGGRVGECLILRKNGVMSINYVLPPQRHFPAILFRMPGGMRINNAPPFCELANVRRNIIGNGKFLGAAIGIVASDGEAAGTLWQVRMHFGTCRHPVLGGKGYLLRATGVGWCLGIGRAGSIVGPMAAAQLIAHHFTNEILFMFAAIPAAISSLLIAGMAKTQPRRERPLLQL